MNLSKQLILQESHQRFLQEERRNFARNVVNASSLLSVLSPRLTKMMVVIKRRTIISVLNGFKQKTPSPRNQQKQTKKERYQQRGSDTESFSPTPSKRMELSTSVDDLSLLAPGVLARLAVCNNDIHGLKKMLQEDPTLLNDVAEVGESGAEEGGLTVLHVACMMGNAECTELIIRLHPNIDALSESGRTALHYACMQGQATCVNLLLSAGADYWLKDIMDNNAKDYAEDAAAGDWALCVAEINAKEVEFGFKMMKRGAGIVSMIAIIGGLCYWLTKKEK